MKNFWYDCEENGRRYIYGSTRVILVNYDYDAGRDDPIEGTEYECEGVVIGQTTDASYPIEVEWDNGHTNQYKSSDLEIIGNIPVKPRMDKDNPNRSFRAHKQKLVSAHMVLDSANMMDEVRAIGNIRKATGMGISEAHTLLTAHNGDVDAAITYYNLEHGSAARSVIREIEVDIELSGEEFDEAQSVDNIANSLSPSTMATDSSSNTVSIGIPGGCDPISIEEIGRRAYGNPCDEVLSPGPLEPTNSVKQQRSKKKDLDTKKWVFGPIR